MSGISQWMVNEINTVCNNHKKRVGGAESTRAAMRYMQTQLKALADTVTTDSFAFHPHAFIASIPLQAFFNTCGILCFGLGYLFSAPFFYLLSPLFHLIALLVFLLEFVLYRQPLDFLFPRAEGFNVFATRKASKETRKRIILCGHADAAYEITFFHRCKPFLIVTLIFLAAVTMIGCLIIGILNLAIPFSDNARTVLFILETCALAAHIPFLFFINWRIVTDGANDNLTGCYLPMAVLKEMAKNDERFEHTDVCCLITDGEESALRGALAFAKANKQMLSDCETAVIVVDTIHELDHLMIYHRGINYTQRNSTAVAALLHKAGMKCGKNIPYAGPYPGGTDAEAFSRHGIQAAGLCAVRHAPVSYYHTRLDTGDNLDEQCLEFTYTLLKEAVRIFNEEGLDGPTPPLN